MPELPRSHSPGTGHCIVHEICMIILEHSCDWFITPVYRTHFGAVDPGNQRHVPTLQYSPLGPTTAFHNIYKHKPDTFIQKFLRLLEQVCKLAVCSHVLLATLRSPPHSPVRRARVPVNEPLVFQELDVLGHLPRVEVCLVHDMSLERSLLARLKYNLHDFYPAPVSPARKPAVSQA